MDSGAGRTPNAIPSDELPESDVLFLSLVSLSPRAIGKEVEVCAGKSHRQNRRDIYFFFPGVIPRRRSIPPPKSRCWVGVPMSSLWESGPHV